MVSIEVDNKLSRIRMRQELTDKQYATSDRYLGNYSARLRNQCINRKDKKLHQLLWIEK